MRAPRTARSIRRELAESRKSEAMGTRIMTLLGLAAASCSVHAQAHVDAMLVELKRGLRGYGGPSISPTQTAGSGSHPDRCGDSSERWSRKWSSTRAAPSGW